MLLFVFGKLGLGEAMSIMVLLQLADRSIKYPRGVIEDVLVKVDKLYFPVDFIVLDLDEERKIPFIIGWSFLATSKTLIDVQQGKLTLFVQDDEVTSNVFKAMKYPTNNDKWFHVDIIDKLMLKSSKKSTLSCH